MNWASRLSNRSSRHATISIRSRKITAIGSVILGNIDIAGVLAFGTPDDVRADVRMHIDRLAVNGGYVVHSSHSIVDAVPHENLLAMVDEAKSYGRFE